MNEDLNKDQVVNRVNDQSGNLYSYMIHCPACKTGHGFDKRWTFNNDFEKPTFRPSMLVKGTVPITDDEHARIMNGEKITPKKLVCHSFVTDGKIKFLGDCTHELKNQTIELKAF